MGRRQNNTYLKHLSDTRPKPLATNVVFDLPFALLVPPGFELLIDNINAPNEVVNVRPFGHPNQKFAVTVDCAPYSNRMKSAHVTVDLLFAHSTHVPATYPMKMSGNWTFRGDRIGKLSHTTVWACISSEAVLDDFQWDNGIYCDLAVDAVNRFLDHFKLATPINKDFGYYVPRVTVPMIMHFRLVTYMENDSVERETYYEMNGAVSGVMPEEDAIKLKEVLLTTAEPNLLGAFDFQILNSLDLQDWRLAIIDSAIMFESWIQPVIRQRFLTMLGSKTKVNKRLSFEDKEGKSHPMPMSDILKLPIEEAFGFRFEETKEYQNLVTKTFSPRNKIVHGSAFIATKETAKDAYESCRAAIELMRAHIATAS